MPTPLVLLTLWCLCITHASVDSPVKWTWIAGGNENEVFAVYGTQGTPSPTNIPGVTKNAVWWYDSSRQEMWLFGGYGFTDNGYGTCYPSHPAHFHFLQLVVYKNLVFLNGNKQNIY